MLLAIPVVHESSDAMVERVRSVAVKVHDALQTNFTSAKPWRMRELYHTLHSYGYTVSFEWAAAATAPTDGHHCACACALLH